MIGLCAPMPLYFLLRLGRGGWSERFLNRDDRRILNDNQMSAEFSSNCTNVDAAYSWSLIAKETEQRVVVVAFQFLSFALCSNEIKSRGSSPSTCS